MPSLRDTQATVAAALAGDTDAAARLVFTAGLAPAERLAIYANNSWMAFFGALRLEFPAVERLGGTDWFRCVARDYRAAHPSRAGNLHHVGAAFPGFFAARMRGTRYEVIADVAQLEWAYQEVLVAADAQPFAITALAGVAPERYGELEFELQDACRLVASPYPIHAIWRTNREAPEVQPAVGAGGGGELDTIDLGAGADHLLVRRVGLEVEVHRLDAATFGWLEALACGTPLQRAVDAALAIDAGFDLDRALARCVALGLLAGGRLAA